MKKNILIGLFASLLTFIYLPINQALASYKGNTEYRIEIGAFIGEASANDALQRIQSEKGWWATVEPTGKSIPYFQVESGGFGGEENVQNILNQFKSTTGLEATYKPIGSPEYHQKIISGSYFGEEAVKGITQEFTNNTGIPATYEQNEQSVLAKRIFSGAYYGEDNVKKIIQDFQSATGLTATYEPTGNYQEYLQVVSGGFYGEQLTNSILQEFKTSTGINASFEPIQFKEIVSIETGGFYGEENVQAIVNQINVDLGITASYELTSKDQLYIIAFEQLSEENTKKVKNYLDNKNWWYTLVPTGSKVPTHYQIVTDSLLDKAMINKALQFFNNHNWWASTNQTGKKTYTYFNIVSNNLIDSEANKGLKFFTDRKLWATIESTNEKVFPYYNLVTDPLLDKEKLDKAKSFFNSKNLWYTSEITGEPIYSAFYIVSQELLGVENNNKVLKFFSDNNWWAASIPTGKKEKYYNIYTGGFIGYDNAASNAQMITDQYGWWATTKEIKSPPLIFLDPGHGGFDPGATSGGYQEADLNLEVAKKVEALLLERGYTVYMSRNNDNSVSLNDRPQMANDLDVDIFVSLHHNAGGAKGIESYYYKYSPNYPSKINAEMHNNPERISKSIALTELIHANLVEYTGANNRQTDGKSFAVLREAAMPATLLELGYIDNPSERQKLVTNSYQNKLAKAIANGIDEYFEIY